MTAATTNDNNLLLSFMKMQKDDANAAAEAECMDKGVSFVLLILSLCINPLVIYIPLSLSTLLGRNDVLPTRTLHQWVQGMRRMYDQGL